MNIKSFFGVLTAISAVTLGVLCFLHFSNDHVACDTVVEHVAGESGEKIVVEKHICK